jgi:molecular chaperone HtpG
VADEHALGAQMEKLLKAFHKDVPPPRRILELNPKHALVATMQGLLGKDKDHPKLTEYAELLYDQALLTAGLPLEDPLRFAHRVSALMAAEGSALQAASGK